MLPLIAKFLTGQISREELAFRLIPGFTLEVIRRYLRVETEGLEHIPETGPAIIIANHSGYAGYDAVMLANEIKRGRGRVARLIAHKLWFFGKPIKVVSEKMGLVEADMNRCLDVLNKREPIIIFPEGEAGNFKPSHRRYRLQEFKRGFVRMAMITGAPIVPAIVIGAEETHINLSQIRLSKYVIGTVIPVPLNVIPLPVKWKIKILPPIYLHDCTAADAMNREKVFHVTKRIRHLLQRAIVQELRRRKTDPLPKTDFSDEDLPGL
jgi:1-acyl-sn-glycerol-3-phosphate acyltransferase